MIYSVFSPDHLDDVLSLLDRSDNTNRTKETWSQNQLTAVLAYDNDRLVGAVPLEPRKICIGNDERLKVLWITGAHVDPSYRSQGVGSRLVSVIQEKFYPEYHGVFVYRADENSRAYKWYSNIGFHALTPILSLYSNVSDISGTTDFQVFSKLDEIIAQESNVLACYSRLYSQYGGTFGRNAGSWEKRITYHYYKESYNYHLIVIPRKNLCESYALIGETSMVDGVHRYDVLEYCVANDDKNRDKLFTAVQVFAKQNSFNDIRLQLSSNDESLPWMREHQWKYRWRTNILGRLFYPQDYLHSRLNSFTELLKSSIKLSIETPSFPSRTWGDGGNRIKIFMNDSDFHQLLLNRCDLISLHREGRAIILDGQRNSVQLLSDIFPLYQWKYHQLDYI